MPELKRDNKKPEHISKKRFESRLNECHTNNDIAEAFNEEADFILSSNLPPEEKLKQINDFLPGDVDSYNLTQELVDTRFTLEVNGEQYSFVIWLQRDEGNVILGLAPTLDQEKSKKVGVFLDEVLTN